MVAGEASGDLLAGLLLGGLKQRWPQLSTAGIGGPRMQAQGFESWWPHSRLAVRGYVEVLRHYPGLLALRKQLRDRVLAQPPDAFIGVDAPDFNLGLERQLRERGVKTIHFVCPSIWAWRAERVKHLAASADHVLCLFPFEPALLAQHGVAATYVGHPLADAIPLEVPVAQARQALQLQAQAQVVAILPGSRLSEIEYLLPTFLQAARLMQQQNAAVQFVLPVVPGLEAKVQAAVSEHGGGLPLRCVAGRSHEVLAACDVTLIASGTATLEAALFKKPMVIGYRMHPLSWWIMKRKQLQPWVGLPNILLRDFAVPELIQERCTPQALADAALQWLHDAQSSASLAKRFAALHAQLRQGMAEKASDAIAKIIQA